MLDRAAKAIRLGYSTRLFYEGYNSRIQADYQQALNALHPDLLQLYPNILWRTCIDVLIKRPALDAVDLDSGPLDAAKPNDAA